MVFVPASLNQATSPGSNVDVSLGTPAQAVSATAAATPANVVFMEPPDPYIHCRVSFPTSLLSILPQGQVVGRHIRLVPATVSASVTHLCAFHNGVRLSRFRLLRIAPGLITLSESVGGEG